MFACPYQSYHRKIHIACHSDMRDEFTSRLLFFTFPPRASHAVDHLVHRLTCSVQSAHTFHLASNSTPTFSCPIIRIVVVGG
jgi:hypothetical protein